MNNYRIVLKFKPDTGDQTYSPLYRIERDTSAAKILEEVLSADFNLRNLKPLFFTLSGQQMAGLVSRACLPDDSYHPPDFFSYYSIDCNSYEEAKRFLEMLDACLEIEYSYLEPCYLVSPAAPAQWNPLSGYQGYLDDAPAGIGIREAWKRKGGAGDPRIKIVDIEQGWIVDHEDLALQWLPDAGFNNERYADHGAGVMGIVVMKNNQLGGIGIAPETSGFLMSQWRPNGELNTPDAILSTLPYLKPGDILLLETQVIDPDARYSFWPPEVQEAVFDTIRLATSLGIVVIEPSGNGTIGFGTGQDLDQYHNRKGERILNRTDSAFKDSGAIMVSAAGSSVPHERLPFASFGNRIDCYAWGENILTAGLHPHHSGNAINTYTGSFGGSSGAAAIIAGVASSLQSMMENLYAIRLDSFQMREVLSKVSHGTASANGLEADRIGVMPDFEKITEEFLDRFNYREEELYYRGKIS